MKIKFLAHVFIASLLNSALFAQSLVPSDDMALLKGQVSNFKGKHLAKEQIIFCNDKSKARFKAITNELGYFEVLLPTNALYSLMYKNFTDEMEYSKISVPDDKAATYSVQIKIEAAKEFILKDLNFDTGKSSIKPASYKTLDDLVEVLKIKSSMLIEIQGHTDDVGSEEANLKLSEARAFEVRKYIISKGISESRVKYKGFGSSQAIADNATEEGRAKNRRTSLKVIRE